LYGCVGGLGKKETSRGFNRATQALRQTGSASKPLAVLAPALDKNIITPSSMYLDEATTFNDGTDEGYSPTDYNDYKGYITVRQATESSQNIPFVKIMEQITPKTSIQYMKKMGISTLTKTDENLNLALGGLDKGITPLEMAAAYACIANDGIYIEPTFYSKIENNIGKTVIKSKSNKKKAFSKQVAYLLKSLLKEPVTASSGTAKYCNINGIDVAAKTGTTNDDYDRWLCGFTPYYSAATWFGFDLNETINFNRKNPSGQIWANVMKKIHSGLSKSTFEVPSGLETLEICSKTGEIANSGCPASYTEYFLSGTAPTTFCIEHSASSTTKSIKDTTNSNNLQTETPDNQHSSKEEQHTQNNNSTSTKQAESNSSVSPTKSVNNTSTSSEIPTTNTSTNTSSIPDDSNTIDDDTNFFESDDNTFEQ